MTTKNKKLQEEIENSELMDDEHSDEVLSYAESDDTFGELVVMEDVEEIPEADLVFDLDVAKEWLEKNHARKFGAYRSIRFEPAGIDLEQVLFVLSLAARGIVKSYKPYSFLPNTERGVLYVPAAFDAKDVLTGLEKGEVVGKYIAYRIA